MLMPRYYFADDFSAFLPYFLSHPHLRKVFRKGEYLWKPGQPYDRVQYYLSGDAVHFSDHESGRRKIISFHGPGTLLPGYHTEDFHIELSLATMALSDVEVLEFTISRFRAMFRENQDLAESVVNWYSRYVNLFLFETIHQEFNPSRVKLCNLLYLLTVRRPSGPERSLAMTQGHKWDIFVTHLSFLGWLILSAVTFQLVGAFYAFPYMDATNTEMYRWLRQEALRNRLATDAELPGTGPVFYQA